MFVSLVVSATPFVIISIKRLAVSGKCIIFALEKRKDDYEYNNFI